MPMRLIRKGYSFVRVDAVSVAVYPVFAVVGLCIIGKAFQASGLVTSFYASPFVMLSALVANRVCIRAGMITAALSAFTHEYLFSAPYWQLNLPTPEQALAYSSNFFAAYAVARRTPMPPAVEVERPASAPLPFTSHDGSKERRFWVVSHDDDWADDTTVGAEYGRIYLARLRSMSPCPSLGWIVRDMIKAGRYTGVEAGFLSAVSRAAASQPHIDLAHPASFPDDEPHQLH